MTTKSLSAIDVFSYLRGALRGTFGLESLRGKKIIIVGLGNIGQELLTMLCFDEVEIFFYDQSVVNYVAAHTICRSANVVSDGDEISADIIIDLGDSDLSVEYKGEFKTADLAKMGKNPYTQGIHDFYL